MRRRQVLLLVSVTTALVAAGLLALWLWRRAGKEGWTYKNKEKELDPDHAGQVYRWCASGKKPARLRKYDEYAHLEKYSLGAVAKVCDSARQGWMKSAAGGSGEEDAVDKADCYGKRMCNNAALRVTHPCMNRDKDNPKCCLYKNKWDKTDLQNCVSIKGMTANAVDGAAERRRGNLGYDTWVKTAGTLGTPTLRLARKWKCMKDGEVIQELKWSSDVSRERITDYCNISSKCGRKECTAVRA